jgi:hypothetical protein
MSRRVNGLSVTPKALRLLAQGCRASRLPWDECAIRIRLHQFQLRRGASSPARRYLPTSASPDFTPKYELRPYQQKLREKCLRSGAARGSLMVRSMFADSKTR